MKSTIFFHEKQKLPIWIFVILFVIFCIIFYGFISQVFFGISFGNKPMSNIGLSVTLAIYMTLMFLIFSCTLETKINSEGIAIKFAPLTSEKFYIWNDIQNVSVVKFSPLKDYLGWGIRMNSKGTAYIARGNMGVQLTLNSGKKIIIGTQKLTTVELRNILAQLDFSEKQKFDD